MIKKTVVTAYTNPDLDGTACAIAYSEYLNKTGKNSIAALSGTPHIEAQFVFDTFNVSPVANADEIITQDDSVILTDASDLMNISPAIDPNQVIEIIDHRKLNDADKFIQAKTQIELVGSCATLIAEKFKNENREITSTSAALLYSAVISNTVNFQADVTTQRDKDIAEWLLTKFTPPDNYIHTMFKAKSTFDAPIKEVFISDFASYVFNEKKLGIAQLEIIEAREFLYQNLEEVQKTLNTIQIERDLDYIFLTIVDIENALNIFYTSDEPTQQLLKQALHVNFDDTIAYKKGITMRKTITPLLKDVLESNSKT